MNRTFLKRKNRSDFYLYGSLMIEKWKILTQIFTFPIQRMKENEKENKKEKEIEVVVYCWSHCLHLWLLSSHQKYLIRKGKELVAAASIEYVLELSPLRMKEKQWEKGKREVKYKIRKKEKIKEKNDEKRKKKRMRRENHVEHVEEWWHLPPHTVWVIQHHCIPIQAPLDKDEDAQITKDQQHEEHLRTELKGQIRPLAMVQNIQSTQSQQASAWLQSTQTSPWGSCSSRACSHFPSMQDRCQRDRQSHCHSAPSDMSHWWLSTWSNWGSCRLSWGWRRTCCRGSHCRWETAPTARWWSGHQSTSAPSHSGRHS